MAEQVVLDEASLALVRLQSTELNEVRATFAAPGLKLDMAVRVPPDSVFISDGSSKRERMDNVYRRERARGCGGLVSFIRSLTGSRRAFREAFGDLKLVETGFARGVQCFATAEGVELQIATSGVDVDTALAYLGGDGATRRPIGVGYVPAVRMRQQIDGEWQELRRFGYQAFHFKVAPEQVVRLEVTVVPLRVEFFVDHVMCRPATPRESVAMRATLSEGFEGVPPSMRNQLAGARVGAGQPLVLETTYGALRRGGADIRVTLDVVGDMVQTNALGEADAPSCFVPARLDLAVSFSGGVVPLWAARGTPVYNEMVRRSDALDRILQVDEDDYPDDDSYPEWAERRDREWYPRIWENRELRKRRATAASPGR